MEEDNLNASNVYFQLIKIHNEFVNNKNVKYRHVIEACKLKLEKYLFQNGMPSIQLFKSKRILDAVFFKINFVDFDEYTKDFPELKSCKEEMNSYKLICTDLDEAVNTKQFGSLKKNKLPKLYNLAKVFLHFPVSTAAVERSFSKYNNMLSDESLSLKQSSIKSLVFLYYNKNIDNNNENPIIDDDDEDDVVLALQDTDGDDDDGSMSGVEEL
jgi:hypothetical protein